MSLLPDKTKVFSIDHQIIMAKLDIIQKSHKHECVKNDPKRTALS